jgi:murein DD-endopeptidase MepM/ murein hydrolase activator NlpD
MIKVASATQEVGSASEKVSSKAWSYATASFVVNYPITRVASFLVLSNLGIYSFNLVRDFYSRPDQIVYENIESSFNRAITTLKLEEYYSTTSSVTQLSEEFKQSIVEAETRKNELQSAVIDLKHTNFPVPTELVGQVQKAARALNCSNSSKLKVFYKLRGGLEFAAVINSKGKPVRRVIKYKNGLYNESGVRLDVADRLLPPLKLITPIQGSKTRISSGYGYRIHPIFKRKLFHGGIDVAAPLKSKIHAALQGTISKIGYCRGYGNYIIVDHKDQLQTLYGHLHSMNSKISIGKKVNQGDIIGYVGQTGTATAPHLHFETRIQKKHVNPNSIKPIHPRLSNSETTKLKAKIKEYEQLISG